MAKVGGFEVEATGFQRCEQRLHAPSQAVIRQCALRAVAGGHNQPFAILQSGGDDVDATAPHPTLPGKHSTLTDLKVVQDPFAPLSPFA
jgi:hypothetical protein